MTRGPYSLATRGKTPAEAAQWWRQNRGTRTDDRCIPNRFMCDGAPDGNRRDSLNDEEAGEFYHQAHLMR
jgi:hypothetical protein